MVSEAPSTTGYSHSHSPGARQEPPGRSHPGQTPVPGRATNTHPPRRGPGTHSLNRMCTPLGFGRSLSPQRKPTDTEPLQAPRRQWPGLELFFFSSMFYQSGTDDTSHQCELSLGHGLATPSLTCPASVTARQCRAPTATCTIFFPRSPSTTCGFRTCTSEPWPSLK